MTQTTGPARSQDEIAARIDNLDAEDYFGFAREVLIDALDYEHAKAYLKEDTTAEQWAEAQAGMGTLETQARNYLGFAIGKIIDHRGISASRSVDKLSSYAWLLGRDDVVSAMDAAGYAQYGAPKVRAFAEGMGWTEDWPGDPGLARMVLGRACEPDCDLGCGR